MTSTNNEETVCYLCLDGDVDEAGHPLRRDCACRGSDAGFVHLSCLAKYAATKCQQTCDVDEFRDPWDRCPSCHQYYQNELAIDIANKFLSFVQEKYPKNTQMQVESLEVKLRALNSMLDRLQPVKKREAGITANVLLSLIDRMKGHVLPLPLPLQIRYSQFEANTHAIHGQIALYEGTEESARRAVIHFQRSLVKFESISCVEGVKTAKSNIACAKSTNKGQRNNEELLRALQEDYEFSISKYGENTERTIQQATTYAVQLQNCNRGDEGIELLMKLLATSKRVLGPDHITTKGIEAKLV